MEQKTVQELAEKKYSYIQSEKLLAASVRGLNRLIDERRKAFIAGHTTATEEIVKIITEMRDYEVECYNDQAAMVLTELLTLIEKTS